MCIFVYANCCILIQVSLQFISEGTFGNNSALAGIIGADQATCHFLPTNINRDPPPLGYGGLKAKYQSKTNTVNKNIHLTHWDRVTHICVSNLAIIGSDNGLSPGRRQAVIYTNSGILSIGPWGTNFSEILIYIQTFSFTKKHLKLSSAKWWPFWLGLNVF